MPSAPTPPLRSTAGNTLALRFTRVSPAPVDYAVPSSAEPSNWTTIAALPTGIDTWTGPASVTETGAGATRDAIVTDTQTMASGTRRFFRLRVSVTGAGP